MVDTVPNRSPVQATTSILGVVMGPIRLEHKGTVAVHGCQSGYAAKFKLHPTGMLTSKSKMHEARPIISQPPADGALSMHYSLRCPVCSSCWQHDIRSKMTCSSAC